LSDATANAQAAATGPLLNAGMIQVYSGAQPVNANTPLAGNTLLVTLAFAATAFGAPSAGVIVANTIAPATAIATGTASFARLLQANSSVVMDVPITASAPGLVLSTFAVIAGATVQLSSFQYNVTET